MILRRIIIPPRFNKILLKYHLIPRNYHLPRGKNRMIPYKYHLITSWYRVIPTRYHAILPRIRYRTIPITYQAILVRYHVIAIRYHIPEVGHRGIVAGGRVLPRRRSTLNPNLVTGSCIRSRPRSTSELVANDRVLCRELVTGGRVHRPRLSRCLRPPHRSSSPVPPPPPRRILRRPLPTPELVDGAVSVTTQDYLPSM
uniref:Uncharacterized protein n=1 Tax=Oryza rufipogon TaxID=4529 RepID=A0A0E0QXP3_ORYRU